MDAISTLMKNLLERLCSDYPQFTFTKDSFFQWSYQNQTIAYDPGHQHAMALLLHELAHALLNHRQFRYDIELVKKESEAWHHATTVLAPRYLVEITETIKEDAMDSYRDWLHARSLCPNCQTNSFQTKAGTYMCLSCGCQWRANQARICELRRYRLPTPS